MRELDGLVLAGGGDLSSCLYNQQPHPQIQPPDAWRDVWERYLALMAWLLVQEKMEVLLFNGSADAYTSCLQVDVQKNHFLVCY